MIKSKKSTWTNTNTRKNSRLASRSHDHEPRLSLAQKIILVVIGIAALTVVVFMIFSLNYDVKYQVEAKISDLAHEYYEEYYYPKAFDSDRALANNFLSRYSSTGLTPVPLRQILLSLPDISEAEVKFVTKYCDKNSTSVTFYPEVPYAEDSFHMEFLYSCSY